MVVNNSSSEYAWQTITILMPAIGDTCEQQRAVQHTQKQELYLARILLKVLFRAGNRSTIASSFAFSR